MPSSSTTELKSFTGRVLKYILIELDLHICDKEEI